MKCQICGSEYPDDVVTCPKDGNALRAVEPPQRAPELMVSAYGMVPMRPPPPAAPAMLPAYGIPPVGSKPRPLLALAIVVLVMAGAIVAVVLSR
jgi:hypothetical protein